MKPKVYNKRRPKTIPDGVSPIYVGRPSFFGNPYEVRDYGHKRAVLLYIRWIMADGQKKVRDKAREVLKGRDLLCWCAPEPCHAEVLLRIANSESDLDLVPPKIEEEPELTADYFSELLARMERASDSQE